VIIDGVEVRDCSQDGIYVAGGAEVVRIRSAVVESNGRTGIAVVHAKDIIIDACV
jgi:hypothetical protein